MLYTLVAVLLARRCFCCVGLLAVAGAVSGIVIGVQLVRCTGDEWLQESSKAEGK